MDRDIRDELITLATEWDRSIENDAYAIGQYMADEWTIVGSDGSVGDKATFLDLVKSGALSHDVMESHDIRVRIYGDTAVVISRGVSGGTSARRAAQPGSAGGSRMIHPSAIFPKHYSAGASMSEESLRALVAGLRSELAQAHDLDANAREGLHRLAREVEAVLQSPSAAARVVEPPLRDRLADRVRELESSHPKLSRTVANIVDTLAFYNL